MDKCPSIIISGQTTSYLFGHIFGEVHMCHSRCATVDVSQQMYHSRCATVDVHQHIMKAQVDILSTNDLVSSLCV